MFIKIPMMENKMFHIQDTVQHIKTQESAAYDWVFNASRSEAEIGGSW